jgi:hypothetical protein
MAPRTHLVAAPPRRRLSPLLAALQLLAVVALLAMPAIALATPRDVLKDYDDNGRIDGCYSAQDYQRALQLANADDEQYGTEVEEIQLAQADRVLKPDGSCGPAKASDSGDSGGGVPAALIAVFVVAGVIVVGGGGLWAYRRSRGGAS